MEWRNRKTYGGKYIEERDKRPKIQRGKRGEKDRKNT
jgi:hypothetical protein